METRDPYLNAAAEAINNHQFQRAKDILMPILAKNPRNAEAWFLLSGAVDNPVEVATCLRNTLTFEPNHHGAVKMMTQLEHQLGLEPIHVMQVGATSAAIDCDCPYCSTPFRVQDAVVRCPKCQTSHHYECWVENGYTCATMLCDGFSLREVSRQPLPVQPAQSDPDVIVICKEDLPEGNVATRKQEEQRFQRRLLLMALMAEEGELPPGVPPDLLDDLPSVDELLDQIQMDRSTSPRPPDRTVSVGASQAPSAPAPAMPFSHEASIIVNEVIPIWPEHIPLESDAIAAPAQTSCPDCGYAFSDSDTRFCPSCGAQVTPGDSESGDDLE